MRRFRILSFLSLCIGCLCCLSCANNSISRLAKQQEKLGRHIDGVYEQLGYLLCSDNNSGYCISKEEQIPIAIVGEKIKYNVVKINYSGNLVFSKNEAMVSSICELEPLSNIGISFKMNETYMVYVFKTKQYYALTADLLLSNNTLTPETTSIIGYAFIDLKSYNPISSRVSEDALRYLPVLSVGYDIFPDGRVSLRKYNRISMNGEHPYIPELTIPLERLPLNSTAQLIVDQANSLASYHQVKDNLFSLQQLATDFRNGNEYLAYKKHKNNWYYIEVEVERLSNSGIDIDNNLYFKLEAKFPYYYEKCDLKIWSSNVVLAELKYPQKVIVKAQFSTANNRGDEFTFENAIPVFYKRD